MGVRVELDIVGDLLISTVLNVVFFLGSYLGFLRYDLMR